MALKIVLVDDHKIVRDGLCAMLEKQQGIVVAGQAENGRDAIAVARQLKPDVVIMDLSMPEMNGIDATREILGELPHCKVIILSMHSDKRFVIGALQAGASGFLLKDCAFTELKTALSALQNNQTYLSPQIAHIVVSDYRRHLMTESGEDTLTTGEREVLQLIAEGDSTKDIAAKLNLSVKAIEARRRKIMEKLNINSVAGLIKYALREGLTGL